MGTTITHRFRITTKRFLAATLPFLISAAPPPIRATPVQCAVALAKTKSAANHDYSKPIVFGTANDGFNFLHLRPEGLLSGWARYEDGKRIDVAPPPVELAREFVKLGMSNAVANCENVRAWLKANKTPFGQHAVKAVVARSRNDELPAGIVTVGVPVVASNEGLALVYSSDVWGGEAAGGLVELYQKQDDGSWKAVASQRLWVS